jgi:hypothetical protein
MNPPSCLAVIKYPLIKGVFFINTFMVAVALLSDGQVLFFLSAKER